MSPARSTAPDAPAGESARPTSRVAWTASVVLTVLVLQTAMWVTGGTHTPTTSHTTGAPALVLGALTVMIALHSLRDDAQEQEPRSQSEAVVEAT